MQPLILSNNYLVRLTDISDIRSEDEFLIDYKNHWPAFLPLYDIAPVIHDCPIGLHMVVWGAKSPVRVRLFDKSSSGYLLKPSFGSDIPHYFQFEVSGFANFPRGSFFETTLDAGEYLFIPRTLVGSFDSGSDTDNNALLRSCFVDASNFRDFRHWLSVESNLAPSSAVWSRQVSDITFDTSMNRDPTDVSLVPNSAMNSKTELPVAAEKKTGGNRRNRGGGMRGNC